MPAPMTQTSVLALRSSLGYVGTSTVPCQMERVMVQSATARHTPSAQRAQAIISLRASITCESSSSEARARRLPILSEASAKAVVFAALTKQTGPHRISAPPDAGGFFPSPASRGQDASCDVV